MDEPRSLPAAVYCRVSTDEQARDGTSLTTQRERCAAFVQSKGWKLVGEYVDEGVSGAKASRPELDRLMDDCRSGKVRAIVVAKLDRFSRSKSHLETALPVLDDLGVSFVSLAESIDGSSASGRMFRSLLGVFAEFEREQIAERTTSGLRAAVAEGWWPGGPAPFGMQIVAADGKHKRLEVDPVEAETIRHATSLLTAQGYSTWTAARELNALGMRPRKADRWDHLNLRRVLSRDYLSGTWSYCKPSGRWSKSGEQIDQRIPAILSPEEHEALRAVLQRTSTRRGESQVYPLSGLLLGSCGSPYHGVYRKDRDLRQYRCRSQRPEAVERCADRRLNADAVESAVWAEVSRVLTDSSRLGELAKAYLDTLPVPAGPDSMTDLHGRIARLEKAVVAAYADGLRAGLDPHALRIATESLAEEKQVLEGIRDRRMAQLAITDTDAIRLDDAVAGAVTRLSNLLPEEQRTVLQLLRAEVRFSSDADGDHLHLTASLPVLAHRHEATSSHEGGGNPIRGALRPSTCSRP